MLFAIADDNCVLVFENESAVRVECEAIDVRNGVYSFFAENGRRLVPSFAQPERKGLFAFLKQSGPEYRLVPDLGNAVTENAFAAAASSVASVDENPHFKSVSEISAHIESYRNVKRYPQT